MTPETTPTPMKGQRTLFKDNAVDEMQQEVAALRSVLKVCSKLAPERAIDVLNRAQRRQRERIMEQPTTPEPSPF